METNKIIYCIIINLYENRNVFILTGRTNKNKSGVFFNEK